MDRTHREPGFGFFDFVPYGTIVLRPDFRVVFWNSVMTSWTGITPAAAAGMNLLERYPALKTPPVISRITQLFEGGPAVLFSPLFHPHLIPCPLPDGTFRVLKLSCVPLDYEGERCALVTVEDVSDLTGQVKAYREMKKVAECQLGELAKAQDAVFQANRKLGLLNSILLHDILNQLTPLNLVVGMVKLEHTDPRLLSAMGRIEQVGKNIEEQIEFAREYQETGVRSPVWQNAAGTIRAAADSLDLHGIAVAIDLPGVEIFADPMLRNVFSNLIENSLRHGEGVTRIRLYGSACGDAFILTFEDDGVGVPFDVKEKIFRREYFRHTGFGLFLSREILAITGITISETGVPGEGARFEILIPEGMYRFAGTE